MFATRPPLPTTVQLVRVGRCSHSKSRLNFLRLLCQGKVDLPSRQSEEFHQSVDEYLTYLGIGGEDDDEDESFDFGATSFSLSKAVRLAAAARRVLAVRLAGPQEGDRKPAADGGWLVLRSGHWTKEEADSTTQPSSPRQRPIEVIGDEFGKGIPVSQIREHAIAYALKHFQGKSYVNKSSGKTIQVGKRGILKTLTHLPDARPALALAKLPEILESAEYVRSVQPVGKAQNVRLYHFFTADLTISGKPMSTVVKVREDNNGHWYYDQHVTQNEKGLPYRQVGTLAGKRILQASLKSHYTNGLKKVSNRTNETSRIQLTRRSDHPPHTGNQ